VEKDQGRVPLDLQIVDVRDFAMNVSISLMMLDLKVKADFEVVTLPVEVVTTTSPTTPDGFRI